MMEGCCNGKGGRKWRRVRGLIVRGRGAEGVRGRGEWQEGGRKDEYAVASTDGSAVSISSLSSQPLSPLLLSSSAISFSLPLTRSFCTTTIIPTKFLTSRPGPSATTESTRHSSDAAL